MKKDETYAFHVLIEMNLFALFLFGGPLFFFYFFLSQSHRDMSQSKDPDIFSCAVSFFLTLFSFLQSMHGTSNGLQLDLCLFLICFLPAWSVYSVFQPYAVWLDVGLREELKNESKRESQEHLQ